MYLVRVKRIKLTALKTEGLFNWREGANVQFQDILSHAVLIWIKSGMVRNNSVDKFSLTIQFLASLLKLP